MSGSLSPDELEGLLADMDMGSGSAGHTGAASEGGISPEKRELGNEIAGALSSGLGEAGTMLGLSTSFSPAESEIKSEEETEAQFSSGNAILTLPLSGPLSGSLHLIIELEGLKPLAARASGVEADLVDFNDEQRSTLVEIFNPTLQAALKTLSAKFGDRLSGQAVQMTIPEQDGSFPLQEGPYLAVNGNFQPGEGGGGYAGLLLENRLSDEILQGPAVSSGPSFSASPPSSSERPKGPAKGNASHANLSLRMDVQMPLTVELGRTKMYIKEILGIGEGSILELDKLAGEPVDLMISGKLIAKGEVVVIDENFGVRVTDIVSPGERLKLGGNK